MPVRRASSESQLAGSRSPLRLCPSDSNHPGIGAACFSAVWRPGKEEQVQIRPRSPSQSCSSHYPRTPTCTVLGAKK